MKTANSNSTRSASEPTTIFVQQRVPNDKLQRYESWLEVLHRELGTQPGFETVEVIRRPVGAFVDFLILAHFDSSAAVSRWLESETLVDLRRKLDAVAGSKRTVDHAAGTEIWHDEVPDLHMAQSPYWKRVLLSAVCVYPLLLLMQLLIDRYLGSANNYVSTLVGVLALSAVLTYPVMPFATRLSRAWLFR